MKWWFSDYDGTINLNHDDSIDKRDLKFINEFIDAGNQFAIASGRLHKEIKNVLSKSNLNYDYIVACNGAALYDSDDNLIQNLPIKLDERKEILEILESNKHLITGYCDLDIRKDFNAVYIKEINENPFFIGTIPLENNHEQGTNEILNSPDINIIYFYGLEAELIKIQEEVNGTKHNFKAIKTHTNVLEIVNKNVSKAFGIEYIMQNHNINIKDVITSGDGENDIEMLRFTNNSFAMKNSKPNVLKEANHVISNVFEIGDFIKIK
ncbi:Cof-type HAD-IIB family hydrolase [Spiroplasma alleghenense]|uniref:HAD superfamily hydrolase n=1 Tax=Spiroplasma alleghenense TaxID=216931 RepID=A0A345Z287_9MOLU|nr:Cof-type HAD-IIB family hydrolase [Spiroplasma alleghenense]AXK50716.1 HAD superfamily hydrolase [Spiroplasma alleghenense]